MKQNGKHETSPSGLRAARKDNKIAALYAGISEPSVAKSVSERQRTFKQSQRELGMVRLEAYVTADQRQKYRELGGDEWLRKQIDQKYKKIAPHPEKV